MRPKSERDLNRRLMQRWWEQVDACIEEANKVLEARRGYDDIPFWQQTEWPHGHLGLLTQRVSRVKCRVEGVDDLLSGPDHDKLIEDLLDLINYARFFLASMMVIREE